MYISQQRRKKNIAEYILYMWQVEDLIRAYGCSITRLQKEYISLFNYSEEQKEDVELLKEIISRYPSIFLGLSTKLKENKELKAIYEENK